MFDCGCPRCRLFTTPCKQKMVPLSSLKEHRDFRPDVEGLRGLAFLFVFLFHIDVSLFQGGFLGVDVFYVISGYVITLSLFDSEERSPEPGLMRFYARRFLRLLPASTAVLLLTLLVGYFIMPPLAMLEIFSDGAAVSLFVANMRFALGDSYFQNTAVPSPLLHYWSLAVEEQFYMVWPLIFWLTAAWPPSLHSDSPPNAPWPPSLHSDSTPNAYIGRWFRSGIFIVLFLVSFTLSGWMADDYKNLQFFALPPRAWEIVAGALVADFERRRQNRDTTFNIAIPSIMSTISLCLIILSTIYSSPATLYVATIPVLATTMFLVDSSQLSMASRILSTPILRWLGERSYALYLVHWPLVIFIGMDRADQILRHSVMGMAMVTVATLTLGFALHRWVENQFRRRDYFSRSTWRGWLVAMLLVALSSGTAYIGRVILLGRMKHQWEDNAMVPDFHLDLSLTADPILQTHTKKVDDSFSTIATITSGITLVPQSTVLVSVTTAHEQARNRRNVDLVSIMHSLTENATRITQVPGNLRPSLHVSRVETAGDCATAWNTADIERMCVFGDRNSGRSIALVGDSHAAHWKLPWAEIARKLGVKMYLLFASCCPAYTGLNEARTPECAPYLANCYARRVVNNKFLVEFPPSVVILTRWYDWDMPNAADSEAAYRVFAAQLNPLAQIVLLADTPTFSYWVPARLLAGPPQNCMGIRADVLRQDYRDQERMISEKVGAIFLDLTEFFCGERHCPCVVGNILVYTDRHHISDEFVMLLEPFLMARLQQLRINVFQDV